MLDPIESRADLSQGVSDVNVSGDDNQIVIRLSDRDESRGEQAPHQGPPSIADRLHSRAAKLAFGGAVIGLVTALAGLVSTTMAGREGPTTAGASPSATRSAQVDPGNGKAGERARLTLKPNRVMVGKFYNASASGFLPHEIVRFGWDDSGLIGDAEADERGRVSINVNEGASPGMYVIWARGLQSGRSGSASLSVEGSLT